jgi:hypothetical protein
VLVVVECDASYVTDTFPAKIEGGSKEEALGSEEGKAQTRSRKGKERTEDSSNTERE